MKKILILFSIFLPLLASSAAPTATKVVEKTVETIQKSPSLSANITIITAGRTATGSFLLSGNRFVIDSDMGSTWYDGTTMWAYSPDTNEVTVTEPTDSELAEINPFQFIKLARTDFTSRLLKSPEGSYTVQLIPKKKNSEIKDAVVTVSASNYFIRNIKLTVNKQIIKIDLTNMRIGKHLPDSEFRFKKQLLPKAEINDLR